MFFLLISSLYCLFFMIPSMWSNSSSLLSISGMLTYIAPCLSSFFACGIVLLLSILSASVSSDRIFFDVFCIGTVDIISFAFL